MSHRSATVRCYRIPGTVPVADETGPVRATEPPESPESPPRKGRRASYAPAGISSSARTTLPTDIRSTTSQRAVNAATSSSPAPFHSRAAAARGCRGTAAASRCGCRRPRCEGWRGGSHRYPHRRRTASRGAVRSPCRAPDRASRRSRRARRRPRRPHRTAHCHRESPTDRAGGRRDAGRDGRRGGWR